MMEKRNRNGGGGREEPDEDLGVAEDEPSALKAPARKPSTPKVETAPERGGAGTRLFILILVIAAAALLYRYWGFWQGGPGQQAAPPAPAVTVSKPSAT